MKHLQKHIDDLRAEVDRVERRGEFPTSTLYSHINSLEAAIRRREQATEFTFGDIHIYRGWNESGFTLHAPGPVLRRLEDACKNAQAWAIGQCTFPANGMAESLHGPQCVVRRGE